MFSSEKPFKDLVTGNIKSKEQAINESVTSDIQWCIDNVERIAQRLNKLLASKPKSEGGSGIGILGDAIDDLNAVYKKVNETI